MPTASVIDHRTAISGVLKPVPAMLHRLDILGRTKGCIGASLERLADVLLIIESTLREVHEQTPGIPDYAEAIASIGGVWLSITTLQIHGDDGPLTEAVRAKTLVNHHEKTLTLQELLSQIASDLESIFQTYTLSALPLSRAPGPHVTRH